MLESVSGRHARASLGQWERVVALVLFCVLCASAALGLFAGLSIWVFIAAVAAPWWLVAARRIGVIAAAAAVSVGWWAVVLFGLMASAAIGLPLSISVPVLFGAIGVAGCVLCARPARRVVRLAPRRAYLGALLGPAVWLGAAGTVRALTGLPSVVFSMSGDAANSIVFARSITAAGGIVIGANPNPLPFALLAVSSTWPHHGISTGALAVDLYSYANAWIFTVAVSCALSGLAAAAWVPARRPGLIAASSAVGSLVPLLWLVGGLQIQYGSFDALSVIPIASAAWLAFATARRSPVVAMCVLLVASIEALASWGPLVLLPVGFALALAARSRRDVRTIRGIRVAALIVALGVLALYAVLVTTRSLGMSGVGAGSALTSPGSTYPLSWYVPLLLVGGAAAVLSLVGNRLLRFGFAITVASLGLGLGVLLFLNRNSPSLWMYYPQKYLWLATAIVLIIGVSVAATALSALHLGRPQLIAFAAAAAVVVLAIDGVSQGVIEQSRATQPGAPLAASPSALQLVLADRANTLNGAPVDAQVLDAIAAHGVPAAPTLYWQSGLQARQEAAIDAWMLQMMWANEQSRLALHNLAYTVDTSQLSQLCSILTTAGAPVTVVTADPAALAPQITAGCHLPGSAYRVTGTAGAL